MYSIFLDWRGRKHGEFVLAVRIIKKRIKRYRGRRQKETHFVNVRPSGGFVRIKRALYLITVVRYVIIAVVMCSLPVKTPTLVTPTMS